MDFISNFLANFFDPVTGIEDFVQDFNENNSQLLTLSLDQEITNYYENIESIITQFEDSNIDVFQTIFTKYLNQNSIDDTLTNLGRAFSSVIQDITLDKIKDFLKVSFSFSIDDLSVALQLPS